MRVHKIFSIIGPRCAGWPRLEDGIKSLKTNKRFIYLISPSRIVDKKFYFYLNEVLKTNKVHYFQLRLKFDSKKKYLSIAQRIKKICDKNKVKFIINDNPVLANYIDADGCHVGQKDGSLSKIRMMLKRKIMGVTCHNSIKFIKNAELFGADYVALGSFFKTMTKTVKYKANPNLINKVKKITNLPIVLIGGINFTNYRKLLLHKPNFLAISGYIWKNKDLNPVEAIKKLKL